MLPNMGMGSFLYDGRFAIAATRSATLRKTPRRKRFWVIFRNQRSTRLSQEALVDVKCSGNCG
jgi:hypothetical protein